MRTYLLIIFLTSAIWCHATPPIPAGPTTTTKTLAWGPSATPGVRYRLYHSTNDLTWFTNYLVLTTNYTVVVSAGSTNWFMVKAVNADNIESDPSNIYEQPIQPKPQPAGPLQVVPVTTQLQSRTPDGQWATVKTWSANILMEPEAGREFRALVNIGTPVELVKPRP